jgi:RNA polymerase sigma-70 factor (ECF subfamily)
MAAGLRAQQRQSSARGEVVYLRHPYADEAALLSALRGGETPARAVLFERHAPKVERLLFRLLGPDPDICDAVQDVFLAALRSIGAYRGDTSGLDAWLASITVFTARGILRRRRARAWLRLEAPDALPELPHDDVDPSLRQVMRRTYSALSKLPANERIVFTLRYVAGMSLPEIADSCRTSRATVIRRLSRARRSFEAAARRDPALAEWVTGGRDGE